MSSVPHDLTDRLRLGVVSFLNARPLVQGLDTDASVELIFDVPSRLADLLERRTVDAALVPVIELIKPRRDWRVVSDACIGCDGETLTVRVFSREAPERVRTLCVDGDSRTSVLLARLIWQEVYGRAISVMPYRGNERRDECDAVLLIGDKVVTRKLIDFEIETDLGSAWKSLTGLPFVFAVWAASGERRLAALDERLRAARDAGVKAAEFIAADFGPGHGWPVALAQRYLTSRIKYTLGPRQREGLARFLELVREHELIGPTRELVFA